MAAMTGCSPSNEKKHWHSRWQRRFLVTAREDMLSRVELLVVNQPKASEANANAYLVALSDKEEKSRGKKKQRYLDRLLTSDIAMGKGCG